VVQADQGIHVGGGLELGWAARGQRHRLAPLGQAGADELGEAVLEQGPHVGEGVG
jgi:hypothetical protein